MNVRVKDNITDIAADSNASVLSSLAPTFLTFSTRPNWGSGYSPTEQMRITNTGQVGMGTSSPADNLTVATASDGGGIQIDRSASAPEELGV